MIVGWVVSMMLAMMYNDEEEFSGGRETIE